MLIFLIALSCIVACGAVRLLTNSRRIRIQQLTHRLYGKNIRDEEASMSGKDKKNKGNKKNKEATIPAATGNNLSEQGMSSASSVKEMTKTGEQELDVREGLQGQGTQEDEMQTEEVEDFEMIDTIRDDGVLVNSNFKPVRVPRKDPTAQSQVPPEVVFFGEPRRPPPVEAARDNKYHGSLLAWARHSSVVPQTSEQRLESVFPRGRLDPQALEYRVDNKGLSFKKILGIYTFFCICI